MSKYTDMRDQANAGVATAISKHLKEAATLAASQSASSARRSINDAEIIARLDRILVKLGTPAEYPVSWVKLEKYVELTGDSLDAVMGRRKLGKWLDGQQCKVVDGRVWVDLRAAQRWVEEWDRISPIPASWRPPSKKPKK